MRVPTISLYNTSKTQLGSLTSDLQEANEVVATQKRINSISDDPIGLTQVLDIKQSLANLEQLDTNIEMGLTWVNRVESSLQSVQELLLDAKLLCSQLVNASVSATERANAVETIEGIIDQVMTLGNAQVNGAYIFAGTESSTAAFAYDEQSASGVAYLGNDTAFSIQTSTTSTVEVGRIGQDVFTEETIQVDSTNNTIFFKEDPGLGENYERVLEATIPDGTYSPEELAVSVRNAMNEASMEAGYQVTYTVDYDDETGCFSIADDGTREGYFGFDLLWESGGEEGILGPDMGFSGDVSYQPPTSDNPVTLKSFDASNNVIDFTEDAGSGPSSQLSAAIPAGDYADMEDLGLAIETAMEAASINDTDYSVTYNEETGRFTIEDAEGTLTGLELLWNSGTNSAVSAADALGFDTASDDTGALSYDSDDEVVLFSIAQGINDTINFKEILPGGSADSVSELSAVIAPGDYTDIETFARAVEDALEDASESSGSRVNYEVSYNEATQRFTIKEDGETGLKLESFELLWESGSNTSASASDVLGFDGEDLTGEAVESESVSYGIFETLAALKEYLAGDDVSGIERSMTRLDTHYESITSTLSDTGMKYNRLETTQTISSEIQLALTERRSTIEDADAVESILNLEAIQTAYEASLSATSKILNLSLADYI